MKNTYRVWWPVVDVPFELREMAEHVMFLTVEEDLYSCVTAEDHLSIPMLKVAMSLSLPIDIGNGGRLLRAARIEPMLIGDRSIFDVASTLGTSGVLAPGEVTPGVLKNIQEKGV